MKNQQRCPKIYGLMNIHKPDISTVALAWYLVFKHFRKGIRSWKTLKLFETIKDIQLDHGDLMASFYVGPSFANLVHGKIWMKSSGNCDEETTDLTPTCWWYIHNMVPLQGRIDIWQQHWRLTSQNQVNNHDET